MTHIEKQTLRELHRPSWRGVWFVVGMGSLFYSLVAATIYCLSQEWYVAVVLLVAMNAVVSHSLVIAFHEAAHRSLCPWWLLNEYFGRLIGLNSLISLTLYRELHHWHHAYLGTPRDEEFWPFTDPANSRRIRILAAISELGFGLLHTPVLYFRAFIRTGSRIDIPPSRRLMIWIESLAPWLVLGLATAVTLHFGVFVYFFVSFLIPAFLAGNIQSWRKYIEHIGLTGRSWVTLTRAIRTPGPMGRIVSESVLHEPFHDLHHRYPKIPYEHLPTAAQFDSVAGHELPRFPSYRAALWDLLWHLPDPKFGPAWQTANIAGATTVVSRSLARPG